MTWDYGIFQDTDMNEFRFYKYTAAGNDFIIADNRDGELPLFSAKTIQGLCHRQFGIGADGVLLLDSAKDHDYRMVYFNADGSRGEMCGNGARALCAFAERNGVTQKPGGTFIADDGVHGYKISAGKFWIEILALATRRDVVVDGQPATFIDTGVPHVVLPVGDIATAPVNELGYRLSRVSEQFPQGANINFIELDDHLSKVRTFERGVDAETLACGTGATACAIYLTESKGRSWPIDLNFPGGILTIDYSEHRYWLSGPVELVFEGRFHGNRL